METVLIGSKLEGDLSSSTILLKNRLMTSMWLKQKDT
jgi:hypothetical protein